MAGVDDHKTNQKSFLETITCSSGTAQDRANQYRFIAWTMAWAVVFTAANWILKQDYVLSPLVAYSIALLPTVIGVKAVFCFMKFLREADEMIRKMQLDGLAFGFGVGVVAAMCYQVFERAGAPHLEIDDLGIVMMLGWMLGQIIAFRRYH